MHGSIPSPCSQHVIIIRLPFNAENSIVMIPQMSSLELLRLSLVEQTAVNSAQLAREGIVRSQGTDFASLEHFAMLFRYENTFLEKRSCLEVACQYSNEPSECVARKECLSSLLGFIASPVTGEAS
jgi:hypothetical protein